MLLVINRKEPKFQLDNDADSGGTCLQGYVKLAPRRLVEKFGAPPKSDGYKTSGEYTFRGADGSVFCLYDWKITTLYDGENTLRPDDLWDLESPIVFNIGGSGSASDFIDWLEKETRS